MWGIVEDNTITKIINNPKALVIGNTRHSRKIFELWSVSELEAIGIYEVVFDNTNKKDEAYYTNTNQSFNFADGAITASYGSATAKAHADTLYIQDDVNADVYPEGHSRAGERVNDFSVGDVKVEGLKTIKIRSIKSQAASELAKTDWYIVRKADAGTSVPSAITTHRAAVRTKCAEMETAVTNASNTAAIQTLYAYTADGDGGQSRPLGKLPTLEV